MRTFSEQTYLPKQIICQFKGSIYQGGKNYFLKNIRQKIQYIQCLWKVSFVVIKSIMFKVIISLFFMTNNFKQIIIIVAKKFVKVTPE